MKLTLYPTFLFIAAILFGLPISDLRAETSEDHALLHEEKSVLPPLSYGVTAAAAGQSNGALLVVGGWDARLGLALDRLLLLPSGAKSWESRSWGHPLAWAAGAQYGEDFLLAGGQGAGASTKVFRLRYNGGQLREETLPDLPESRVGSGAAVLNDTLYVVGGMTAFDSMQPANTLWSLDLKKPETGWQVLAPLPGAGKVLPVVSAQYGQLQVFGGRESRVGADGKPGFAASAETWVYLPKPLEGTYFQGWKKAAPLAHAMAAGSALAVGQAQNLVLEGDVTPFVAGAFDMPESSGHHPVWLYHSVTNSWVDTQTASEQSWARLLRQADGTFLLLGSAKVGESVELRVHRTARSLGFWDYIVIAGYFIFIAGIGFYCSHKQESSAEFSLGNRKVLWWAAGISMFATGASAISFMAIPALAFSTNLIWALPLIVYLPAYFIQAHLIFPLLRRMEITSTYEYLDRRFNRLLRTIASIQCIIFQTFGRASVVLVLPSLAISATTGLNVYLSVVIMGVVTTIYTSIGGFSAVIWTEVFQGILKFVAPIIMIAIAIIALPGGFKEFVDIGTTHEKFTLMLPTWDITYPALWMLLLGTLLQATVMQAGDQPMIQRVFSSPMHEVRRVAAMSVACSILIGVIVNVMGVAIFAYFHTHPEQLDALGQNDQIVPYFTMQALPVGVAGMVIAAIFASAMATVASSMNSVATIFTTDFYQRWKPEATDRQRLRVLKMTSYLVGFTGTGIALFLASQNLKSIMVVWTQVVSLTGGGIVGVYSLGMFTRRANGTGAVIGAIASIVITALVKLYTPVHWSSYIVIAVFSCMGIGYLASLFWGRNDRDLSGLTVFTPRRDNP